MKKTLFLLFLLPFLCEAQERFNREIDLEFPYHNFTSVHPTDSCYYVTGVITDTSESYAIGNIFARLDLEGELLFYKKISNPQKWYETWWGDLTPTPDGGFIDVGTTVDSTIKILLIKYNALGDTLFTKEYPDPFYPLNALFYAAEIKFSEDGHAYILARVDSDSLQNDEDIYLLKLDENLEVADSFFFGEPGADIPLSTELTPDGNIVIGSKKTNEEFLGTGKYSRAHVFEVTPEGEVLWEYESPNNLLIDVADDLLVTDDGGIVAASGKGIEHIVNPSFSLLKWFPYLFKLNSEHELEWAIELRGTRQSYSSFVKVIEATNADGYVATGQIAEDATTGEEVWGSWLVKVSPEGDSLWARYFSVFGGAERNKPWPYDLKNTPDGGYVITGHSQPEYPDGTWNDYAWILKVDEHGCLIPGCEEGDTVSVATGNLGREKLELAIYPNPVSDFLNFQLRGSGVSGNTHFRITDVQGKAVRELESRMPHETHIVPVWDWPSGIYFLQYLENGEVRATERFVVGK